MIIEFLVFSIGIVFGSFGNNVISHFTDDQQFDLGRSNCLCSKRKLKWYENIPLFSYLFLQGNCLKCEKKISFRYFFVEISAGVFAVLIYLKFQPSISFIIHFLVFYIMLLISVIDFKKLIIPNQLLIFLFIIATLNLLLFHEQISLKVFSSLGLVLLLISVNFIYSKVKSIDAIGYGDIKYIGIITLIFTFPISLLGLWFSALIALPGFYIIKRFNNEIQFENRIPFGTFISVGYFITTFADNLLIKIYNQILIGI